MRARFALSPSAFGITTNSSRATYVVLSALTILALTLFTSVWHGDLSSSVAVIGLVSVYIGSVEMLAIFMVLAPCSLMSDIARLVASKGAVRGHGEGHTACLATTDDAPRMQAQP